MHLIKHFSFLFLCFLMSMLISACGAKGDLYQVDEPKVTTEIVDKNISNTPESTDNSKKKQL